MRLEPRVSMRWDLVVRQGDPGDWMGFISSGTIAVLVPRSFRLESDGESPDKDAAMRILSAGAYFGEPALFAKPGEHRRACSLQALSWVQLQVITLETWNTISQLHPHEMQFCREQVRRHVKLAGYVNRTQVPTAATVTADVQVKAKLRRGSGYYNANSFLSPEEPVKNATPPRDPNS